jgi:hypothetical protein
VDCEVDYNGDLTQPDAKKIKGSMISCCKILEVQWTPTSLDAYMMLEAWMIPGRLGIFGHHNSTSRRIELLDDALKARYTPEVDSQPETVVRIDNGSIAQLSRDFPLYNDGEWYIEEREQVHCAKVALHGEKANEAQWLVLKCLEAEAQVYERIGMISSTLGDWACTESKKRVKVV